MTKACWISNMAEREALKREIEKLQNLIKDHKRVHGDAPSSSSQWIPTKPGPGRGRCQTPGYVPSYPQAPDSSSQWKQKYSLKNKTTRAPGERASLVSEASLNTIGTRAGPDARSLPGVLHEGIKKASAVPLCSGTVKETSPGSSKAAADSASRSTLTTTRTNSAPIPDRAESGLFVQRSETDAEPSNATLTRPVALDKKHTSLPQVKPDLKSTLSSNRNAPVKDSHAPTSQLRLQADSPTKTIPPALSSPKKSRFTWVKAQGSQSNQSTAAIHPATSASTTAGPKHSHAPSKKLHRKLAFPSRTSSYSWVSSSCSPTSASSRSVFAKLPHRRFSHKALKMPLKASKDTPEGRKPACVVAVVKRAKVSGGASTPHTSHASRYRWKAAAAASSAPRSSRKSSVYRWTAQGDEPAAAAAASRVQHGPPTPPSNKQRSRTRISSPTSERRPHVGVVTVRSRYSLRRKAHPPAKASIGPRRGSRVLVSVGRHRLRRLSPSSSFSAPWNSRSGPFSQPIRNAASHRVFKTRYKIDTRRAQLQQHNHVLSYRVKRVQSARFLLQSRLRAAPDRQWRGRGMRWISGSLYRVSANKLSRTHTPAVPANRSGKFYSPHEASFGSNACRTSNSRHVASRAVQKSLAIIRQARQKKQQAQNYCMYYNRFGKCNRGTACPFIHDPDKVAVCTRFLRGTCKQTDGTCPFSHKVSKEKMPVCSYFLKGICNNSSCPYSHVYVSRKAAVCQDFIRGYCPQGEKCKKKHTLECPDFSRTGACPQGTKCKLQHRQRVKRAGSCLSSGPGKRTRSLESAKRPEADPTPAVDETQRAGCAKLPSFISLSTSPEAPEGSVRPSCQPGAGAEGTGKKLHIKPRFLEPTLKPSAVPSLQRREEN